MSSYEYYEDHESVAPEIELESYILFDEVQNYLRTAPKIKDAGRGMNSALVILRDKYPYNDIAITHCSLASAYNPKKDITAVINELTAMVDGDPKQAFTLEFFKGVPFGYTFNEKNFQHCEVPPVQSPNEIASVLQGATAVWDLATHCYDAIAHDSYGSDYNSDTLLEDYVSMRLWLRGADLPLDVS